MIKIILMMIMFSNISWASSELFKIKKIVKKNCLVSSTGFMEVIPSKEDRYILAKDLPDKHMRFSCNNKIEIRYFQKNGIVTIEAVQFPVGKNMTQLAFLMGSEQGLKTKELKDIYSQLRKLREQILKKKNV